MGSDFITGPKVEHPFYPLRLVGDGQKKCQRNSEKSAENRAFPPRRGFPTSEPEKVGVYAPQGIFFFLCTLKRTCEKTAVLPS